MKKILILSMFLFFFWESSYAYNATSADVYLLQDIEEKIDNMTDKQLNVIDDKLRSDRLRLLKDERIIFILNQIKDMVSVRKAELLDLFLDDVLSENNEEKRHVVETNQYNLDLWVYDISLGRERANDYRTLIPISIMVGNYGKEKYTWWLHYYCWSIHAEPWTAPVHLVDFKTNIEPGQVYETNQDAYIADKEHTQRAVQHEFTCKIFPFKDQNYYDTYDWKNPTPVEHYDDDRDNNEKFFQIDM